MSEEKKVGKSFIKVYGTLKGYPLGEIHDYEAGNKDILKNATAGMKGSGCTATSFKRCVDIHDFTPAAQNTEIHTLYQQHSMIDLRRVGDKIALLVAPMARDENDKSLTLLFADLDIAENMFSKMIVVIQKMRTEKIKFNAHMREVLSKEK